MAPWPPLAGARVLVTGGSSGIGLEIARLALALGARVTIVGRSRNRLDAVSMPLHKIAADVSDAGATRRLFADLGTLDYICHCAGPATAAAPIGEVDPDLAEAHLRGRFWSAFNVAQGAATALAPRGSLVFVVGAMSQRPMKDRAIASAAQSAVLGLMKGLTLDLAPRRVNAIVAGLTNTAMWDRLDPASRQALFDAYAAKAPAGIVGEASHIADIVLATITNPYMTGSVVVADGGSTLA